MDNVFVVVCKFYRCYCIFDDIILLLKVIFCMVFLNVFKYDKSLNLFWVFVSKLIDFYL